VLSRLQGAIAIVALLGIAPAAALTRLDLKDAGFHLVPGASMPAGAVLHGQDGRDTTLGQALAAKPALLVFTDYRCESLCGVILDQLAAVLPKVGLTLGRDYNVIAVALDAAQTPADAMAFRDAHTKSSTLQRAGLFFTNDAPALQALRASVGLVAPFDVEHQQFAHPAGLILVDAQGLAQRVLSPFALDPLDLKLALTEGGAAPLSLGAHALLLCYGWNPVAGLYTLRIERVLMLAGAATILLIALTVAGFLYRARRLARSL
jgi:protein SCO1/2